MENFVKHIRNITGYISSAGESYFLSSNMVTTSSEDMIPTYTKD